MKYKLSKFLLLFSTVIPTMCTFTTISSSCTQKKEDDDDTIINDYLTLEVKDDSSLCFWCSDLMKPSQSPNLYYACYDPQTKNKQLVWRKIERMEIETNFPTIDDISLKLESGKKYFLRGDNLDGWVKDNYGTYTQFGSITINGGDVRLSGSIMSLLDNGKGTKKWLNNTSKCFDSLFILSTGITKIGNIFSNINELGDSCFSSMFNYCINLVEVPKDLLPWDTLAPDCFHYMFAGCTSLTTAPDLPATNLKEGCYQNMFDSCSHINSIKLNYMGNYQEDYFWNWFVSIDHTGTFYYNGNSSANNFGLYNWTVKKFFSLYNGSNVLFGSLKKLGSDYNDWKLFYPDQNFTSNGWTLDHDIPGISINDQGKVLWNNSLDKTIYEFKVILHVQYNNENLDIISNKIVLCLFDDSTLPSDMNVRWVGHRGTPSEYFESSIESFECSGNDPKYDGIETDIHITTDNKIVCVHDSCCFWNDSRTEKDTNTKIESLTYAEVRNKWLISGMSEYPYDCRTHQYIPPLLSEYLNICYKYNKTAVIEIKNDYKWGDDQSDWKQEKLDIFWNELIPWIRIGLKFNIISFDNLAVKYLIDKYQLTPDFFQMLINGSADSSHDIHNNLQYFLDNNFSIDCTDWQISEVGPNNFDPSLAKGWINAFHAKGLKVNIYTINSLSRAQQLIDCGADYVTSNYRYDRCPR